MADLGRYADIRWIGGQPAAGHPVLHQMKGRGQDAHHGRARVAALVPAPDPRAPHSVPCPAPDALETRLTRARHTPDTPLTHP